MDYEPQIPVGQTQTQADRDAQVRMPAVLKRFRSVGSFNRACNLIALACFLLYGLLLPVLFSNAFFDFPQYFMGGLAARYGAMDSVYPTSTSDTVNPGWPDASTLTPKMFQLATEHGCPTDSFRYIQPPPNAYFYAPFTLLNFHLSKYVWGVLMMLCVWGVATSAGKILELLAGRQTPLSGLIVIILALTPRIYIGCQSANVSQLVGLCVAVIAVELIRGQDRLGPLAMTIGAVTKYFTLPLGAVYVLRRRWFAIGQMALLGGIVVGLTVLASGLQPWRDYFALSRTFDHPAGPHNMVAFVGELTRFRLSMRARILVVRFGLAIPILLGSWFYLRRRSDADRVATAAYIAVLMSASLLSSTLFWGHYLLFIYPMWGWLAWEVFEARKWRALAVFSCALLTFPLGPIAHFFSSSPMLFSYQLWGTMIILFLGMARLFRSMQTSGAPG